MYGQNHEDDLIKAYLDSIADDYPHRFLDVGAYSPTTFSNTRILVEDGWSGVYVEPAPGNFNRFLVEYHDNEKMTLVNAAIARDSAVIDFWDSGGDALSTSVPDHVHKWSVGHIKFRRYLIKTMTMTELLDAVNIDHDPVSVLSLDVEAMNFELFNLIPFERMTDLKVVVVEHDGHQDMMAELVAPFGFKRHHFNGENIIFVR